MRIPIGTLASLVGFVVFGCTAREAPGEEAGESPAQAEAPGSDEPVAPSAREVDAAGATPISPRSDSPPAPPAPPSA